MFLSSIIAVATQTVLTVFAAASLHAAFPELGTKFEAAHPGVTVRFTFNGSQILETQLAQGAQADVFASADQRSMDKAKADGLVTASAPFAGNYLVIIASMGSPVQTAHDLTILGLRIVLCSDAVPCGRYARTTLAEMEKKQFEKGFAKAVLSNVVSEEENVEAVVAKVSLSEADAGIVYRSDAEKAIRHVRVVEVPEDVQPLIIYPIAVTTSSTSPGMAADFVAFVRSSQGQRILQQYGFAPAP
ncbi:MAG TPA: molybdate ABC transporter substrate-binding protein [Candidatus Eremiobacteraceae bacterium]|nr:molybdate ABC transporter substrate-binding protein [Candidatus Eremiobacteraceae bacterium]